MPELPVLADVIRSEAVESTHRGSVVAVRAAGHRAIAVGAVDRTMFPRSAVKPVQALAVLRCGVPLEPAQLAVACSSHSGTPEHVAVVRSILGSVGLSEADLRCPADLPLDASAARAHLRAGGGPERVLMNCSGKHAAMLAACAVNDWPLSSYLDPDHPLQRVVRETVRELAGVRVAAVAVDGCGAPLFGLPLAGLARAFGVLVAAAAAPERQVVAAMRAFPDLVGGPGREVGTLIRAVPGLLAKDGAEGVYGAALADGTGIAVKIEDGGQRAAAPVLVATLRALGVTTPELDEVAAPPVLGGGRPVGAVTARPLTLLDGPG